MATTCAEIGLPESVFTDEEEQIEHVTNTCAHILEDLNGLQFEQQQEINKEKEEFNLIHEEVNEAASNLNQFLNFAY